MNRIITDEVCNKVYFSSAVVYYQCWRDLKPLLERLHVGYGMIRNTRDLWVRDFMPIQVNEDRMVQFVYRPSYLNGLEQYRSDPSRCRCDVGLPIEKCDLLLDGGNVIRCDDCVLVSDRVFAENAEWSSTKVVDRLEQVLGVEVVIVSSDEHEMTGHVDGMVRYVGGNRVILNHYVDFDRELRRGLMARLSQRFEVIELHLGTDKYLDWSWAYLNYMRVGDVVCVPCFESRLDVMAYRQLEEALGVAVYPIRCRSTVKIGGGLNCLSWTVKINGNK